MRKNKITPKELYFIKVNSSHFKVIEKTDLTIFETRLTDKAETFKIIRNTLETYLKLHERTSLAEINDFIKSKNLDYKIPDIQLSLHFQHKLF